MTLAHPDSDAQLVATFASTRSSDALERLLARHWSGAYRLALRALGSPAAAEDVAQQAFLDLVEAAPRFDATREFGPWFRTLVLNRVRKHERGAARRRAHEQGAASLRPERATARASARLEAEEVAACVTALPEDVRLPIVLHYYEGLTHAEVALALGCPTGTAASRIRRGLEQLSGSLASAGAALALPDLETLLRSAAPVSAPRAPAAGSMLQRGATTSSSASLVAALALATLVGAVVAALVLPGTPEAPPAGPQADGRQGTAVPTTPPAPPGRSSDRAAAPHDDRPAEVTPPTPPMPADARTRATPDFADADAAAAPAPAQSVDVSTAEVELVLRDDLDRPLASTVTVRPVKVVRIFDGQFYTAAIDDHDAVTVAPGAPARVRVPAGVPLAFEVDSGADDQIAFMMDRALAGGLSPDWTIYTIDDAGHDLVLRAGEARVVNGVVPRAVRFVVRATGPSPGATLQVDVHHGMGTQGGGTRVAGEPYRQLLTPGKIRLRITSPGHDTFERELDAAPGEEIELTPALNRSAARVVGHVVNDRHQAVAGASVRSAARGGEQRAVKTAADGSFELLLDAGQTTLVVSGAGHATTRVQGEVGLTPWVADVTLRTAGEVELLGRDLTGAPLAGAVFKLRGDRRTTPDLEYLDGTEDIVARLSLDVGFWGSRTQRGDVIELGGEAGSGGVLRLSGVPPGRYEARLEGGEWRELEVRAGEVARLVLTPSAR